MGIRTPRVCLTDLTKNDVFEKILVGRQETEVSPSIWGRDYFYSPAPLEVLWEAHLRICFNINRNPLIR